MSDLTAKFSTLEAEMTAIGDEAHSQRETIESTLENIHADLASINSDLLLMKYALLGAIGQSGACFPCPTPSITVPPTGTTTFPVNPEHCQRSQWIVTAIQNILTNMDTLQSFNVVGSYNVISDAISQIVGAIAAGDTIPLPSFPETVNIVGDYIGYAGERAFSGVSLSTQFAPLYGPLVTAVNYAGNASSAQSAYNGVIDVSSASNGAKLLFKALAYNALWSYAFDEGSDPDLSAFDGGACGIELPDLPACTAFGTADATFGGHTYSLVFVPPSYGPYPTAIAGDYNGFRFKVLTGPTGKNIGLYKFIGGVGPTLLDSFNIDSDEYTISTTTEAILIVGLDYDSERVSFTLRICPPS